MLVSRPLCALSPSGWLRRTITMCRPAGRGSTPSNKVCLPCFYPASCPFPDVVPAASWWSRCSPFHVLAWSIDAETERSEKDIAVSFAQALSRRLPSWQAAHRYFVLCALQAWLKQQQEAQTVLEGDVRQAAEQAVAIRARFREPCLLVCCVAGPADVVT